MQLASGARRPPGRGARMEAHRAETRRAARFTTAAPKGAHSINGLPGSRVDMERRQNYFLFPLKFLERETVFVCI